MVEAANLLRGPLLAASRQPRIRQVVEKAPVSRSVVKRFVAGDNVDSAIETARSLIAENLLATLDHLGEDTLSREQAEATVEAYLVVLRRLSDAGLASGAEVSVKLSAVGQALDPAMATTNAAKICDAAAAIGTTVTLDMEDHTTTDATLATLRELRSTYPWVGAVLQAYLHRTEADCRDLATEGSRVRLCKGAYREPPTVAFQRMPDINESYLRCLDVLLNGPGYPMIATHDPAMVEAATTMIAAIGRARDSYELQMLHGVRPDEQRRLAAAGHRVRVYLPYGDEWYGYLMRRLAERPSNVGFFLRALLSRR